MANIQKVSLLTFIEELPGRFPGGKKKGLYRCVCGSLKPYFICNVRRLHTLSCGCRRKSIPCYKTHGLSDHPLYFAWSNIIQRCTNPKDSAYEWYGAKGVTVCEEWRNDFKTFYDWCIENGWKPGLEIDKDVKGGNAYSPQNCILIDHKINSNNRQNNRVIKFNGKTQTLAMWSEELGISGDTLRARLGKLGWSLDRAMTTPLRGT